MTPRIRRFLALVLLVATAVGCGGGDPTITSQQLATIMPSSADAPPGTTLGASESGPRTLVEFVSETDVRRKLEQLGFKVAYQATFATPAFPADPSKAPPGAALYGAFAVVLRDGCVVHDGPPPEAVGQHALPGHDHVHPHAAHDAEPLRTGLLS